MFRIKSFWYKNIFINVNFLVLIFHYLINVMYKDIFIMNFDFFSSAQNDLFLEAYRSYKMK